MKLDEIGKELSKLANFEVEVYIKRGELIFAAKEYFSSATEWLSWSKNYLGTGKASHYKYVTLYKCFNNGTFGKEMKILSTQVLYSLSKDEILRNKARVALNAGVKVDDFWVKNNQS
ncbi:hypothetical protein [Aliivibrio finisterrensis]|uniref:Uncharacterized protein n=1 Tax=Aliivibrio finisterrensis TaxID=511998 RepID=A0A6N6RNW4_9GAMM|nr:hypothetical protein [Aliivibrio finisterrensis]KAB2822929.1 hypothetical protein F8B77_17310 [Aliivibrio finisterrensis]KAB2823134.1 hypothetical protein F8B77_16845 [Aliivibrio finisterrensis]